MKEQINKNDKIIFIKHCIRPEVGNLLSSYAADLLSDSDAEEVEDHLVFCRTCRVKFLKVLSIGRTMVAKGAIIDTEEIYMDSGADIVRLNGFKKPNKYEC